MAIRNSTEFLAALKADLLAKGIDAYGITAETETTDSSGTMRYGVVMMQRRPRHKADRR